MTGVLTEFLDIGDLKPIVYEYPAHVEDDKR